MVAISVVMAVHDGSARLPATVESILSQTFRDIELIAIDDGSQDETAAILAAYAERDARVRTFSQQNLGLTRSLIRGCREARGFAIARHDCGDRSLPERLERQYALLAAGSVLVGSASRFVDDDGDLLYVASARDDVRSSLLHDPAADIRGLVHGTAMFRRDAYLQAGEYREQFRLAQDLDLWIRLAHEGNVVIAPEVLYESHFTERSLSAGNREAQQRLTAIAVALRDGGNREVLLADAAQVEVSPPRRSSEAAGLYFMGKCMLRNGNSKGRTYLKEAVRRDPLHWRAWLSLLRAR